MAKDELRACTDGARHYAEGIPRSANPYMLAAFSNGARNPLGRPSVRQWFAGWDSADALAKATGDAA